MKWWLQQSVYGLTAMLALFLLFDAGRLLFAGAQLHMGLQDLETARMVIGESPLGWTEATLGRARGLEERGRDKVVRGTELVDGDWLLGCISWLPGGSAQTQAVVDLTHAARAAARAGADFLEVADRYRATSATSGAQATVIIEFLEQSKSPLLDAHDTLSHAEKQLRRDLSLTLLAPVRREVAAAQRALAAADKQASIGATAAAYLPQAMGLSAPRTYLVLLANPSEIRPSGGFYGAIGYVTVDGGKLTKVDISNSAPFSPKVNPPVPVPPVLGRYLKFDGPGVDVSDAGWDQDFPTTARLIESMMQSATGRSVDGTISIDPYAIGALLDITGPVTVEPYGTFTSQDFFTRINVLVNATPAGKDAIGPIAAAILTRVLAQPSAKLPAMLDVARAQAEGRHVVVYTHQPDLQKVLADAHFDGSVLDRPADQDYLSVIDANVAGTKGDAYVHKSLGLKVERYSTGLTRHELTASYEMPSPVDAVDELINPHGGAYRDYVRFYLPEAATVRGLYIYVDGKPTTESSLDTTGLEHGKRFAGAAVTVFRGHSVEVHLFYEVPLNPDSSYRLLIQKQIGSPGEPSTLDISLPGAGIRHRTFDLHTDEYVSLTW